ncbi:unnamed protein product, partial [Symbiodinium sp. CCMP2456]
VSLQFRLHQAFIFYNSSNDIVETLLEARADVNEQLRIANPIWRAMFLAYGFRHRFSPS